MSTTFRTSGSFSKLTKNTASQLIVSSVMISYYLASSSTMAADVIKLPAITVSETREAEEGYNNNSSSLNKLTSPLKDTPRTVTSVSRTLMDDQAVMTLRDALRNVPGLSISAGEGGNQGDNFNIRGFSARNDMYIDGMHDWSHYSRDPFNLESVEVLKGPSSVLLGRGSTGGIINQQTKEAHLEDDNKSSVALGTNATKRFTTDVNKQISDTTAFRINLMAHKNEVEGRDVIEEERFGIAPSLSLGLGTDTRLKLDYTYQNSDAVPDYGLGFTNGRARRSDHQLYYGFLDDHLTTDANIATAKFEHDFNKDLSVSNKLRYGHYSRDFRAVSPTIVGSTVFRSNTTPCNSANNCNNPKNIIATDEVIVNQTDLTAKFNTFGIKHDSISGVEISRETSDGESYNYNGVPSTSATNPVPTYFSYTSKTLSSERKGSVKTLAAYISDTAHLTDKLDLIGSARYENIRSSYTVLNPAGAAFSTKDDVISWSAGTNYKLTENGSVYASTGTSFDIAAAGLSLSAGTANSDPEKAKNYEVGTKWDFFKKKLSASLAVFRTDKTNVREETASGSGLYTLIGRQVVDGFEAQISGNLTDNWKVFTGYAYLDGQVKDTVITTSSSTAGATLAGTPRHSYNLFTTYKLPFGLEVGGGLNYVSKRIASTSATPNTAPGYIVYNAMAKYNINEKVNIQLNVENLTNTYYFDQVSGGRAIPGENRVFMLTTNFSF